LRKIHVIKVKTQVKIETLILFGFHHVLKRKTEILLLQRIPKSGCDFALAGSRKVNDSCDFASAGSRKVKKGCDFASAGS